MPKVAGTYRAIVKVKTTVREGRAESKEAAIRDTLLDLGSREDRTTFEDWVKTGMEIELVRP